METLVLYDSKKGFTRLCAETIISHVAACDFYEITSKAFSLNNYKTIIIGAPIYNGKLEKKAISFIKEHKSKLLDKKLGIFCAGMNKEEFNFAVQNSLPPEIFYRAQIVHCGGKIDYSNLSLFQKLTIKRRLGISSSVEFEKTKEMLEFINWINGISKEKIK